MSKLPPIIAVLAGLSLSGCAASPWSGDRSTLATSATAPLSDPFAQATPPATPPSYDAQRLQDVMAELRQLGTVDAAAQDRLMEDLRQSDPSLWPLVIEQFRATLAYRRRAVERNGATAEYAQRLPPTEGPVTQASYAAPAAVDWRQPLAGAIAGLEAQTPKCPTTSADLAQQARLRLLYAAAGRRDEALQPIPGAMPAEQEFFSKELEGLTTWLDVDRTPDAEQRAVEAKPILAEALGKLSETAPLAIRNPTFCSEVLSFGCLKRFEKYEFCQDQQLLLYAEVENFASEPTQTGYHTSLRSKCQILDSHGAQVVKHDFAATEDNCQALRRDFFLAYRLRLPKKMTPGAYTLRLSIEDLKSHKTGQASIEFKVKEGKAPEIKAEKSGEHGGGK